jgi:predicted amidohydrolase YtcJ
MLPELAKNGITSISDARCYWQRDHHLVWKQVEQDGLLTTRVNLGLWAYPDADDATQLQSLRGLYESDETSLLKINQIKVYIDGITINTTAAMHEDYLIDLFERPTNNGLNYFTQQRLTEYLTTLSPLGFDFHIHAIGNRGITEALNAIEASGATNNRHRLTHIEVMRPSDYSRFAQLNVTADAQVAGDFSNPQHWSENIDFIGATNSQNIIPLKSLNQAGARITLSSDHDVSTLNPFIAMQNAVTRVPQELSLAETIKAYTVNAAYTMRQENLVGSIEVNKEADLIVLNQNLMTVPVNSISETRVDLTILQGRIVFRR